MKTNCQLPSAPQDPFRQVTSRTEGPFRLWTLVGYGNPNCQGVEVWRDAGEADKCADAPTLAASYAWVVDQRTIITSWAESGRCASNDDDNNHVPALHGETMMSDVGPGGEGNYGCFDAGALGVGGYQVSLR
jgi:hypothetical protein